MTLNEMVPPADNPEARARNSAVKDAVYPNIIGFLPIGGETGAFLPHGRGLQEPGVLLLVFRTCFGAEPL